MREVQYRGERKQDAPQKGLGKRTDIIPSRRRSTWKTPTRACQGLKKADLMKKERTVEQTLAKLRTTKHILHLLKLGVVQDRNKRGRGEGKKRDGSTPTLRVTAKKL